MKKRFLYIGLTSLFLLGCSKKVNEINFETINSKIEEQEDFIVVLSSKYCDHCKNLKKEYNKSKYKFAYYEVDFIDMLKGIENNNEEDIKTYQYFAELTEYAFSNVESFLLGETYQEHFNKQNTTSKEYTYKDINGENEHLEGYVNLVTPLSYFYIDGKLTNFEYADYSHNLNKVMDKYQSMLNLPPFNPYNYIHELNIEDIKRKIDNKEDFILSFSSKNCSWCQRQFNDIYDRLYLNPTDINFYYVDSLLIDLEKKPNGEPINGQEVYDQAKENYRFFASIMAQIGDYMFGEGTYIKENYTHRFGVIEPAIIYPTTFIFLDGEASIELSSLGYGWTENDSKFKTFLSFYNSVKG